MLIDMHIHESTCSADSQMTLEEIVATAKERGLDAICITDHDSMGLKERAEAYSREVGFPIFVGVEYYSLWGDITAFGIDGFPQERIPAQDFIDQLELFSLLANVADVKSLAIHPASTTHSECNEAELLDQGIKPNTIRLSIGTEHIDDIIEDLAEAFKAVR